MTDFKKFVESYGNFKVSDLGNGLMRIHAHNDHFTLGAICNESKIRGSIKVKDGKVQSDIIRDVLKIKTFIIIDKILIR